MTMHDDDGSGDGGAYPSVTRRHPNKRRKLVAVGVAGLATLLGVGGLMVTTQIADRNNSSTPRDAVAIAPTVPQASGEMSGATSPAVSVSPSEERLSSRKATVGSSASASPVPPKKMTVDEKIAAARADAAKEGHPLQRALTAEPGATAVSGPVTERSEKLANGTLRIITAKHDLTGQRELLWAGDKGKSVGKSRCTQQVRFSENSKPAVRPNLLLCWRTSAAKSVVTVLINHSGKPSMAASAGTIAREWAKIV